jgi:hypothetical protein
MADPVSWLMIESGWRVVASGGEDVGRVEEVAGDSSQDIWDGLSVASGILSRPQYVAAEQVASIVEGEVRLALTKDEFSRLGEFREPPTTADVEPEGESLLGRAEAAVEAPTRDRPERVPLLRRILLFLGLKRR